MKYSICYNPKMKNSEEVMLMLKDIMKTANADYELLDIDNLKSGANLAFVIGGDGTILKSARFYASYDTPIFGINLGRLGFLSQTSPENLEYSINKVLNGEYRVEERMMLSSGEYTAVNDFVIKGCQSGRTSRFKLEINSNFVCEYLADGIIVSSPTGSTAYSMSAGGAIISPNINAITIVPICPHTFSARPLIISENDEVKIIPAQNCEYNVASDGQIVFPLNQTIIIKKHNKKAKLALLKENEFYSVLRNKLQWGISPIKE